MSSIIAGITKDLKAVPENLKAKAKGADAKKLLLLNVPYILAGYFCDKVAWLWRVSEGADASAKMIAAMNGFDTLFSNPLPSFHPRDLLIGAGCGIALRLVVYYKGCGCHHGQCKHRCDSHFTDHVQHPAFHYGH